MSNKGTYCDLCDDRLPESRIEQHKHLMNEHGLKERLNALTSREWREDEPA
jgi:hypothetical protein